MNERPSTRPIMGHGLDAGRGCRCCADPAELELIFPGGGSTMTVAVCGRCALALRSDIAVVPR